MSDSNLDDFFAKKDKSKKKVKSAKVNTGEIQSQKSEKKSKKNKDVTTKEKSSNASSSKNPKEDDEWNDYEEEAHKDFSDLKIANLQKNKEDGDEDRGAEGSGSEDEDGKGNEKKDTNTGPWNKATVAPPALEPVRHEPKPEPPKEEPKPTGKYVPPSMRRAKEAESSGSLQPVSLARTRAKKKATPDVMSEEDFPTLGAVDLNEAQGMPPGKFEPVRGGSRPIEDPRATSQRVELGNKFDALSQGES